MIFLGIGSNLPSSFGNRFKNIDLAISFLLQEKIKLVKKSSFYESFSYPNKQDPKFINVVILIESNLSPTELMKVLISIEKKLERKRGRRNNPRTCDLDILDYKKKIMDFKFSNHTLTIPHKRISNRNFVLYPLKEISPNWVHPVTKKSVHDLINDLKTSNNEITKLSQNDINNYVK
tara:strand:+ start:581 stop:1111 length:531 start_codon:yes stop_codon:yes gene_type:complete